MTRDLIEREYVLHCSWMFSTDSTWFMSVLTDERGEILEQIVSMIKISLIYQVLPSKGNNLELFGAIWELGGQIIDSANSRAKWKVVIAKFGPDFSSQESKGL